MNTPILFSLLTPAQYREGRERVFQSDGSLQWYVRQHRAQLIDAGALLLHAGRWMVHPDQFDAYVLNAGASAAKRATDGAQQALQG